MNAESPALVAGVRLPGLSRLRFCEVTGDVPLHAWVAVAGPHGDEAALVVVAPQQIVLGQPPTPLPRIVRTLAEDEVAHVARLADRARRALDLAIEAVRGRKLPLFVSGLRFTLDGQHALVSWRGPADIDLGDLSSELSRGIDVSVHLDREGSIEQIGGNLFGGVGRLRVEPVDTDALALARFSLPGGPATFAPEGLPRLGSRVLTAQGAGSVRSISTRHREASVLLDSGSEVRVPIDDLRPAGDEMRAPDG